MAATAGKAGAGAAMPQAAFTASTVASICSAGAPTARNNFEKSEIDNVALPDSEAATAPRKPRACAATASNPAAPVMSCVSDDTVARFAAAYELQALHTHAAARFDERARTCGTHVSGVKLVPIDLAPITEAHMSGSKVSTIRKQGLN